MKRVSTTRSYPPTRVSGQLQKIVDGSPLAIIGIFISVLRERFSGPDNPDPEAWAWVEDIQQTKLVIESAYCDQNTLRNRDPAIFVDKDQSVYGKIAIGDRAAHQIKNSQEVQWTLSTVPILIECIAKERGESAILGDIVHWTLQCASDVIQSSFGLHDMTPATCGRTVPYERNPEAWSTPVTFQVQYNVVWSYVPIAPLLQGIMARIDAAGTTASDYFTQVTLRRNESPSDDT